MDQTDDFFICRIDQMIDLRHPLCVLASHIHWQEIEASLAHRLARQVRSGKKLNDVDLFGDTPILAGRATAAGRPRLPFRLMVALLYLKHAYNESDEGFCERWGESPVWQYFSGSAYFEHRFPCDPTQIGKFRPLLGEEGVEELLAKTVSAALNLKLIAKKALNQVIVDSTVQQKAIAHPTDSRLLETARSKLVEIAKASGIELKQTYAKEGRTLSYKAGRYAHAKQYKRMKQAIKRQSTIVGRLARHIERQIDPLITAIKAAFQEPLSKALQIAKQSQQRKGIQGKPKLYSWHAPEVSCINKGKAKTPYQFGCKVGIAATLKGNLILGARSFPGNPFDGHTLNEQLEQVNILLQDTGIKPSKAFVDLGYRGVDSDNPGVSIIHRGKNKRITQRERHLLRRRQAIEPIIGHLKQDHRMDLCHLKGSEGDAIHAILCAAGYNIKWLLRMIKKKGIRLFLRPNLFGLLLNRCRESLSSSRENSLHQSQMRFASV